jgi:hypothetical protein
VIPELVCPPILTEKGAGFKCGGKEDCKVKGRLQINVRYAARTIRSGQLPKIGSMLQKKRSKGSDSKKNKNSQIAWECQRNVK